MKLHIVSSEMKWVNMVIDAFAAECFRGLKPEESCLLEQWTALTKP